MIIQVAGSNWWQAYNWYVGNQFIFTSWLYCMAQSNTSHRLAKHSHVIDKHFSMFLPRSCGGGTLIDTKTFARKQMANELAILSFQTCMLTALDRALAVFSAHSTIDTHCTARNLKKIPAGKKKILRENFYKLCRRWARQWGAIQYNRWRLCCREHHGIFLVSWGLK